MYFFFGAHVHADGRLVKDQKFGFRHHRLANNHLLLVASGEVSDQLLSGRCFDGQALDHLVCVFPLPAIRIKEVAPLLKYAQADIGCHGKSQDQALIFPVFRYQIDAMVNHG